MIGELTGLLTGHRIGGSMNFIPKTRQIIIGCVALINMAIALGWIAGQIEAAHATPLISMSIGGFLTLLKGDSDEQ